MNNVRHLIGLFALYPFLVDLHIENCRGWRCGSARRLTSRRSHFVGKIFGDVCFIGVVGLIGVCWRGWSGYFCILGLLVLGLLKLIVTSLILTFVLKL